MSKPARAPKVERPPVFEVPSIAEAPSNLKAAPETEEKTRFLNVRVPNSKFKEIKKAALDLDMDLGSYVIHLHDQANGGA